MRILTNPPFDYIIYVYSPYLQNFKTIKDQELCYRLIFLVQVFCSLK